MNLTRDEVSLIRTLGVSKSGLHVYTIYRKAGIAAPAMSSALANLQRNKLLELEGELVSLTQKGKSLISTYPSLLVAPQLRLQDRLGRTSAPNKVTDFSGPSIGVNEFYVPRTSELPRSLKEAIALAKDLQ